VSELQAWIFAYLASVAGGLFIVPAFGGGQDPDKGIAVVVFWPIALPILFIKALLRP